MFWCYSTPRGNNGSLNRIINDLCEGQLLIDGLLLSLLLRCGHCKAMEPEYNKLAKWLKKKNPKLLVAKMDATANDLHVMFGSLKGYPTIFFLPMDNKEKFIQYQEESFTYKEMKVSWCFTHPSSSTMTYLSDTSSLSHFSGNFTITYNN